MDWVPAGAWLAPGYAEWPAPPALRGVVACLWASVAPGSGGRERLVLPDACSDLIWEQGVGAYVAGPDTCPTRVRSAPDTVLVGVRFRPAAGGSALGLPLSESAGRIPPPSDRNFGCDNTRNYDHNEMVAAGSPIIAVPMIRKPSLV